MRSPNLTVPRHSLERTLIDLGEETNAGKFPMKPISGSHQYLPEGESFHHDLRFGITRDGRVEKVDP